MSLSKFFSTTICWPLVSWQTVNALKKLRYHFSGSFTTNLTWISIVFGEEGRLTLTFLLHLYPISLGKRGNQNSWKYQKIVYYRPRTYSNLARVINSIQQKPEENFFPLSVFRKRKWMYLVPSCSDEVFLPNFTIIRITSCKEETNTNETVILRNRKRTQYSNQLE